MIIRGIHPGSIAEQAGLCVGDDILTINGHRLHDIMDYRFHDQDDFLALEIRRAGEQFLYEIEKDFHETLGIDLDDLKITRCGNDCVFCFVDQNPKGLRHSIYFRDGDYRFSFLYGNFVTLTNVGPKALERIIRLRLSPLYISVHSTDIRVRIKLMGMKKDDGLLDKMRLLSDGGIEMHTQIVLCPGINDGVSLRKTIEDLWRLRPMVRSLALVPVGLTEHRSQLFRLQPVTPPYATEVIDMVRDWQKRWFRPESGRNWIYPSDEFFILAGRPIPGRSYYDGFEQIENGVGLTRRFLDRFNRAATRFPARVPPTRLTIVTGSLAEPFLARVATRLNAIDGLTAQLAVAENTLFGASVTVAGLLSGHCIYNRLQRIDPGDLVMIPPETLNFEGVFLDDTDPEWLSNRIGKPVLAIDDRWSRIMDFLRRKVALESLVHNVSMKYLDHTEESLKRTR